MKVLVTGASGFAGSHLVEALKNGGDYDIYGTAYGNAGYLESLLPNDHILSLNLLDREATLSAFRKVQPDWVFHLAALAFVGKSFEKDAQVMQNNIGLQLNVLRATQEICPKARVLTTGSAEEYGLVEIGKDGIDEEAQLRPVNPYAVSKVAQDLLAHAYAVSFGLDIVRARPFNHIGERQTTEFAVPAFAEQIVQIERGQLDALHVGNLETERDFTDVKDMVQAYILLLQHGKSGDVYNIGTGQAVKMSEIVNTLISFSNAKISIVRDESRMRPADVPRIVANAEKIRKLGWKQTIRLEDSLRRVLKYSRAS